jgi:hypothetical protein
MSIQGSTRETNSQRRRWQFSLRTVLLLVVVASVPIAFWGKWFRDVYSPKFETADCIVKLGGVWMTNDGNGPNQVVFNPTIAFRRGNRGTNHQLTDTDLAVLSHTLSALPKLELDLSETAIGDAGLEHLETLSNITALDVKGTAVTDAGIARLKNAVHGIDIRR